MKLHVPAATQKTRDKRQSMRAQLHTIAPIATDITTDESNTVTDSDMRAIKWVFMPIELLLGLAGELLVVLASELQVRHREKGHFIIPASNIDD